MVSSLTKRFEKCWSEYHRLIKCGEYYAALMRVANVFSCLSSVSPEIGVRQRHLCNDVSLNHRILDFVHKEIEEREFRIRRITSIGSDWNEDELLLLITIRIENDLLTKFIRCRKADFATPLKASLSRILKTARNKKRFKRMLILAKKNWGLPIKHPLFVGV